MKKVNNFWILIIGILLFFISYNFDQQVSLLFKDIKFAFFDFILSIITNFGVVIIVLLLIPLCALYKNNKKLSYLLLLTFVLSLVAAFILKLIVLRQRPTEMFTYPFTDIINYSFPSMHAMVAFAFLPTLTKYLQKYKYFWVVFAVLIAFSRLYFGFHFLSDVVFGALVGYFIGDWLLELYENEKLWK